MRASLMMLSLIALLGGWLLATEMKSMRSLAQSAASSSNAIQGGQNISGLTPGSPLERELAGGQVHTYRITLTSGHYLHVIVEQRSIDVVVKMFGSDHQPLAEVNNEDGAQRQERIILVAEISGEYRLEVRPVDKDAANGDYEVRVNELREATPQDRTRASAESAYAQGRQLRNQGTAESLRKAIEKFEAAIPLWRAISDRRGVAQR